MRFTCVRADINLKEVTVNSASGDYNPTSLAAVINTEALNSMVVQTWLDKSGTRNSLLLPLHGLILAMQIIANPPLYFVLTLPTLGSSRKRSVMLGLTRDTCIRRPLQPNVNC